MVGVRSITTVEVDRRRDRRLQLRQQRADAVDGLDDVGARLAEDDRCSTAGLPLASPALRTVLDRVAHVGDVGQPHRRAVAVGDDQRAVLRRLEQLVGGADLPASSSRRRARPWGGWRWRCRARVRTWSRPMP